MLEHVNYVIRYLISFTLPRLQKGLGQKGLGHKGPYPFHPALLAAIRVVVLALAQGPGPHGTS